MLMRPNELASGLTGAWLLFLRNRQGLTLIDCSQEGAIRSFLLAVLLIPVYVVILAFVWAPEWGSINLGAMVVVESLGWIIGWTAMPVIVYALSTPMGVRDNWLAFVSAYNWSVPIQLAIIIPIFVLGSLGLLPGMLGFAVFLIATLIRLSYLAFVIRTALDVGPGAAIGLTALDFILGLFLETHSDAIIRSASAMTL